MSTIREGERWEFERGVTCVVCPGCAFTFDAFHTDEDGTYSCPCCGYPHNDGRRRR